MQAGPGSRAAAAEAPYVSSDRAARANTNAAALPQALARRRCPKRDGSAHRAPPSH